MDAMLSPWIARADALVPLWRTRVRDASAIPLQKELLATNEQRELRETIEVLALAHQVDASLVGGDVQKPLDALRLVVQIDPETSDGVKRVFQDWREEEASAEFTETVEKLHGLRSGIPREKRIELEVEIRLVRSKCSSAKLQLGSMIGLLDTIDCRVFQVTQIKMVIATAYVGTSSLCAMFQAIEKYVNTAGVLIHLDLGQSRDDDVCLADWKRIFDLTTKSPSTTMTRRRSWDIEVNMSGSGSSPNDAGNARVVAACFSALAHADNHVTSVTLHHPLQDPSDKDAYKPTERRLRAKWLGYFLRVSRIERVTICETTLAQDDMDAMASTLQARTIQDCLRALWHDAWHELKVHDLSADPVSHIDDTKASKLLVERPLDIVGIMQDLHDDSPLFDVLVAGYGQCTVPRSSLPVNQNNEQLSTATGASRLKSLRMSLTDGDGAEGHLLRMVMSVGKDLEELSIDAEHSHIALSVLIIILASCPRLKRLSVRTIYLSLGDDEQLFLPSHWANHPLEDLSVDLHLNEAAIGLCGLASMLVLFGVQLKSLRIRAQPPIATNPTAIPAFETMLRTCCQSLQSLEIVGLSVEYFQELLSADVLGLRQLGKLALTDTASDRSVWERMVTAMARPAHPLTQSLHTLELHVDVHPEFIGDLVATMLVANDTLVNCELVSSSRNLPAEKLRATHGRALRRQQAPLSLRQKAAFLSSVQHSVLPWETSVLGAILMYAAPTEARRVVVTNERDE